MLPAPGGILLFSGAQLHASIPNTSGTGAVQRRFPDRRRPRPAGRPGGAPGGRPLHGNRHPGLPQRGRRARLRRATVVDLYGRRLRARCSSSPVLDADGGTICLLPQGQLDQELRRVQCLRSGGLHDLIPGGAHTYAKGDDPVPGRAWRPLSSAGAGGRVGDIDGNGFVEFGSGPAVRTCWGHGFEPVVRCRSAGGWKMVSISSARTVLATRGRRAADGAHPERRDGQVRPQRVRRNHGRGAPGSRVYRP